MITAKEARKLVNKPWDDAISNMLSEVEKAAREQKDVLSTDTCCTQDRDLWNVAGNSFNKKHGSYISTPFLIYAYDILECLGFSISFVPKGDIDINIGNRLCGYTLIKW